MEMESQKRIKLTVQGVINPVPAAVVSEKAGYPSSSSSDCNAIPTPVTPVMCLAGKLENATSNKNIEEKRDDPFLELGKLIEGLMDYVKGRNNVHHAIKDQVLSIRVAYNKARDKNESPEAAETIVIEQATQTTAITLFRKREPKRKEERGEAAYKMPEPKRARRAPQSEQPTAEMCDDSSEKEDEYTSAA